jgi:hypothetical protein
MPPPKTLHKILDFDYIDGRGPEHLYLEVIWGTDKNA